MSAKQLRLFGLLAVIGVTLALSPSAPRVSAQNPQPTGSNESEQVVARMVSRNQERARTLESYRSRRHYHLDYTGMLGARQADMVVDVIYRSPDQKEFTVVSEGGSKWICSHVLRRLMQVEQENARSGARERTEINSSNYKLQLLNMETAAGGSTYYVMQVEPKTENGYLFRGKVRVEARDFAVARIEGVPSKNPSRWTKQSDFRHDYQSQDGFWLPTHNDTVTQLHMLGQSHLVIEYTDYQVTRAAGSAGISGGAPIVRPETSLGYVPKGASR